MATDGRTLVWYQGWTQRDILKYERLELWAAPYTTSAAELRPRRVVEVQGSVMHTALRVGFGYAVALAGEGERAVVYDLESGATAELLSPPGTEWRTTFVGPEEVAPGRRGRSRALPGTHGALLPSRLPRVHEPGVAPFHRATRTQLRFAQIHRTSPLMRGCPKSCLALPPIAHEPRASSSWRALCSDAARAPDRVQPTEARTADPSETAPHRMAPR